MQLVYEGEQRSSDPDALLAEQVLDADPYTEALVRGVASSAVAVDEAIARYSRGWSLSRMPAMDRAILRIATFELLERRDVPTAVVLNEAVELANDYSTPESGRFVNGVLGSIAAEVRGTD